MVPIDTFTTKPGTVVTLKDFLQRGMRQVAAGYIIYGSSTILVYATKRGVNGFTLDQSMGEFCLSHPNIKCPGTGKMYSVNHGNFFMYNEPVKKYIDACQNKTKNNGGPYTQRYWKYGFRCSSQSYKKWHLYVSRHRTKAGGKTAIAIRMQSAGASEMFTLKIVQGNRNSLNDP